jgi:hypothetical protein
MKQDWRRVVQFIVVAASKSTKNVKGDAKHHRETAHQSSKNKNRRPTLLSDAL